MTENRTDLSTAAASLRALHVPGTPLVLINAWDAASAQRVVAAGSRAVATSSAAVAASLGLPDSPDAPIEPMFQALERIARVVEVPVSADLLDGYGLDPAELVERMLAAGIVGCNLEDSDHSSPGTLVPPDKAAERLAAVRAAAARAGVDIVLNARIDAYLYNGPDATADVITRAREYLAAGADCIYPVSLTDPATVRKLVDELGAPINANPSGDKAVSALAAAGAARLSIGPRAHRVSLAVIDQIAKELLEDPRGDRA